MQNNDNSLVKPKRRNRKRGKKTNQPTTHAFWSNCFNPRQLKPLPKAVNAKTLPILNKQEQPGTYQTPDQQVETLIDLTDDTAPSNPMIDSADSVKKPEAKQEDQKPKPDPKQQPAKCTNFKTVGNRQIVKTKLQNPGLKRKYYQEEDFTQDIDEIDFTDYISGQNKSGISNKSHIVVKKEDTAINIKKLTENKAASKPIILSNQLVTPVPVTVVNHPVASSNKPVHPVNKPIVTPKNPTKFVNQTTASSNKPVTPVNKPIVSSIKPVNKPITVAEKIKTRFPSLNKKFIAANKPAASANKPAASANKPAASANKPAASANIPVTLANTQNTLANSPVNSNPINKKPGEEAAANFIVANKVDSTSTTLRPVTGKKRSIQVLNRTFQAYVPTPIMEPKNDSSNMVPPQASKIQQQGNMFYNPMLSFALPKGIPRSFLQPRLETVNNSQPNPQTAPQVTNTMPNWPTSQTPQYPQQYLINPQTLVYNYLPYDNNAPSFNPNNPNAPITVQTENLSDKPQQYSPSETYADLETEDQEAREGSESPDLLQGQKRLSAFKRLGPQTQPKKPKLTINLMFNKEQAVREVVGETDEKPDIYKPVHLREDIISSKDDTVVKYLPLWPWRKNVSVKKHVSNRRSKSVMILELEQMQEEVYEKDNMYVQITIEGYPPTWKKDKVLDIVLESVKGRSFIPIFIEFNEKECKFFVIRCRPALMAIHKYGFIIRQDEVELKVTISQIDLTVKHIDFIPRLVLRKRLSMGYDGERKLSLKAFTLGNDISHFLYYPLHRLSNQMELVQLQSTVAWDYLTDLDLSHNKLTTLQGFGFPTRMPKLKHLDLSHNYLEKATILLSCRGIPLNSIWLEGNPLCNDYTDPNHYIRVLKMMFPSIQEIDGTPLLLADKLPTVKKNYCPEDAAGIVNKFLEVFFPLLESGFEHRNTIHELYEEDATMTITYKFKLRYGQVYRYYRNLFLRCRVIDEGEMESVEGSSAITKLITKWPGLKHDPYTFTVDVMYHDDKTAILRISGIVKLTAETLAEDEHLLAFTRTLVLHSHDGEEYKIKNEMVYWDEPTEEYAATAFKVTAIKTKPLSLKLESTPDDDLKEKLTGIFMQLTDMEKAPSIRCLEMKEWNLKNALEYFTKLLKLDSIESI